MLFNEGFHRRISIMLKLGFQASRPSPNNNMFMDLYVAAVRLSFNQALEATQFMLEQAKVPIWIISVLQPFAEKHESPVDPVSSDVRIRPQQAINLLATAAAQDFVRIE